MKKTILSLLLILAIVFTCGGYACNQSDVNKYTVQIYNDREYGKVTGVNAAGLYTEGTLLSMSVTPKEGYKVKRILWNGESVEIENGHYVTFEREITSNSTLEVVYSKGYFLMSVENDNEKGTVSGVEDGASYKYGEFFLVTIAPKTGYKIDKVFWNKISISVTNELGFSFQVAINTTSTLSVSYLPVKDETNTKTVSITNDDTQGVVSGVENGKEYEKDSWVTISVTPNEGCEIKSVLWNGVEEVLTDNEKLNGFVRQKQITQDSQIVVIYNITKAVITVENDNKKGGVSGVENGKKILFGKDVEITIVSLPGYIIERVSWNGVEEILTEEQKKSAYSFTKTINEDSTLVVEYVECRKTASVTNNTEQGEVSGIVNGAEYGFKELLIIAITPKENYVIKSVSWNGEEETLTEDQKQNGYEMQKGIGETNELVVEYELKS